MHLTRIDELSATIEELSARIDQEMRPFVPQIERLVTIPGVKKTTAEVIIAETGADMTRFRTPANLASWAGVCPGHHESAGIQRSGKRRHGKPMARWCPGYRRHVSGRTRERTYLGARYARLVPRLGKQKTIVAVEHSILTAVWHMLTDNVDYHDLAATTSPNKTPNAQCDASSARPTPRPDRPLRPHPRRRVGGAWVHFRVRWRRSWSNASPYGLVVRFLAYTGLRWSEIAAAGSATSTRCAGASSSPGR